MALISDFVLDAALNVFTTSATRLDITSSEPTTYAQATSTASLGNKTGITVSAPANATPNGRMVTISAITDGTVTATGTATHYAITDPANSRLLAAGAISSPQVVTSGNVFTTSAANIRFPDVA